MSDILIHNANICFTDRIEKSSLLVKQGLIAAIGNDLNYDDDVQVIDAKGKYLLPGFIDVHTHLDDIIGGFHLADTYETGSKIALKNGITTIYSFVTQQPNKMLSEGVKTAIDKAKDNAFCNIGWHITPTRYGSKDLDDLLNLVLEGFSTIKLYTTYKEAGIYSSYKQIRKLAERLKPHDVTILVHCEDEEILDDNKVDQQINTAYAHAIERTEEAEIKAVGEIITIARETGVNFHVVHVSSYEALKLITEARDEVNITCETCPQYFLFNEDYLKDDDGYKYLCTPPLRGELTRLSMYEAVINNEVDLLATDHCAFTKSDKSKYANDFRKVPKGLGGIGSLIPLAYETLKYKGEEGIMQLSKMLSENPAKLINKYPQKGCIEIGSDADLVLLSEGRVKPVVSSMSDLYNPYEGMNSTLKISHVLLGGDIAVEASEIRNENPKGKLL